MKFATKQIHAGVEPDPTTGSVLTPIYQTTTYVQPSLDEYLSKGYSYSRTANPTVRALERRITQLNAKLPGLAGMSAELAAAKATLEKLEKQADHLEDLQNAQEDDPDRRSSGPIWSCIRIAPKPPPKK